MDVLRSPPPIGTFTASETQRSGKYDSETKAAGSATTIQKPTRTIQQLRFISIHKPRHSNSETTWAAAETKAADSETKSDDSETNREPWVETMAWIITLHVVAKAF